MASGVQDDSKEPVLSSKVKDKSDSLERGRASFVEHITEDEFQSTPVVISCQPEPPPVEEKKTGAKEDVGHHSERLPRYDMGGRPRGICVIINNIAFPIEEERRHGTEKDEKLLRKLFTKLHFTVDLRRDLTRNDMESVMEFYGRETDHSSYNAFICIIMSHGKENDLITGVDEKIVRIEDIMAEVDAQHCPSLQNKPKLFFIQSCRGGYHDKGSDGSAIQADSTLARSVCPTGADFLLAFATTPGYVAWRTPSEGTYYIRILADVIDKLHKDVHLLDMLTVVNREVSEEVFRLTEGKQKQIPAPSFTLRAQVYL